MEQLEITIQDGDNKITQKIYNNKFKLGLLTLCLLFGLTICLVYKFVLLIKKYKPCIRSIDHSLHDFTNWLSTYNQTVSNNQFKTMLQTWITNDLLICQHNIHSKSYTMRHNQFSGMNSTEWQHYVYGLGYISNTHDIDNNQEPNITSITPNNNFPSSVDWRAHNAVTDVKDQGSCGSCWAFATTGALEGAYAIKYHDLISFSEQQLINCSPYSCGGGSTNVAFDWIQKNNGICPEWQYPYGWATYNGITDLQHCSSLCFKNTQAVPSNIHSISTQSDTDFISALNKQPVIVGINANPDTLQFYSSGIYSDINCNIDNSNGINHAILAVGYNENSYIIKNSWGTSWGNKGFGYLQRTIGDTTGGQCGILYSASYPVL